MDKINTTMRELYFAYYNAIKDAITPYGNIYVQLMFRYVDDDNEQDIYLVKMVYIDNNGELCHIYDTYNGENYAADTYFSDDDCFDGESDETLNKFSDGDIWAVDYIHAIYNEVVNYAIPRLVSE